jgi:hypothetical protein
MCQQRTIHGADGIHVTHKTDRCKASSLRDVDPDLCPHLARIEEFPNGDKHIFTSGGSYFRSRTDQVSKTSQTATALTRRTPQIGMSDRQELSPGKTGAANEASKAGDGNDVA